MCPFDAKLWTHSIGAHGIVRGVQLDLHVLHLLNTGTSRKHVLIADQSPICSVVRP